MSADVLGSLINVCAMSLSLAQLLGLILGHSVRLNGERFAHSRAAPRGADAATRRRAVSLEAGSEATLFLAGFGVPKDSIDSI